MVSCSTHTHIHELEADHGSSNSPVAICVGSIGNDYSVSKFSNFGEHVQILAPGEKIPTTSSRESASNGTALVGGSQLAAAHVTGILAIMTSVSKPRRLTACPRALRGMTFFCSTVAWSSKWKCFPLPGAEPVKGCLQRGGCGPV